MQQVPGLFHIGGADPVIFHLKCPKNIMNVTGDVLLFQDLLGGPLINIKVLLRIRPGSGQRDGGYFFYPGASAEVPEMLPARSVHRF